MLTSTASHFSDDERAFVYRQFTMDPITRRPRSSLVSLEPRSGKVLGTLELGAALFGFAHPPDREEGVDSQPGLLLVSEGALRFFDPLTFTRSGAVGVKNWFGFPFASSPSGRIVAYTRGGSIGVLPAARLPETDGQTRRVRSLIVSLKPEESAYGLGVMGAADYGRQESLGLLIKSLFIRHEIVRKAALLRLQWDGIRDPSASNGCGSCCIPTIRASGSSPPTLSVAWAFPTNLSWPACVISWETPTRTSPLMPTPRNWPSS